MVGDLLSFFLLSTNALASTPGFVAWLHVSGGSATTVPVEEPSNQCPATQLHVSGDLTKLIAVFAEDWLHQGDCELLGVQSADAPEQDFKSCSGNEGSLGFDPPDEFMCRFRYPRDLKGFELGAMNISVMDLKDSEDSIPKSGPTPTGVS